ncbi:MAG: hypothetical protein GY928_22180 [Colwellia sp.]|nr:hypothetical protein [Colwellia sp.]
MCEVVINRLFDYIDNPKYKLRVSKQDHFLNVNVYKVGDDETPATAVDIFSINTKEINIELMPF